MRDVCADFCCSVAHIGSFRLRLFAFEPCNIGYVLDYCEDMVWQSAASMLNRSPDGPGPAENTTTSNTRPGRQDIFSMCMATNCASTSPTKFKPEVTKLLSIMFSSA
jgi:hypothetical protein